MKQEYRLKWGQNIPAHVMDALKNGESAILEDADGNPYSIVLMDGGGTIREKRFNQPAPDGLKCPYCGYHEHHTPYATAPQLQECNRCGGNWTLQAAKIRTHEKRYLKPMCGGNADFVTEDWPCRVLSESEGWSLIQYIGNGDYHAAVPSDQIH